MQLFVPECPHFGRISFFGIGEAHCQIAAEQRQKVAHGASRWGKGRMTEKPREGREKGRPNPVSFAAPQLVRPENLPTACAVGYLLSPLRG